MNLRKSIPDYFTDRANTTIQIVFTSLFAFVFINIYKPFGSGQWYDVSEAKFLFYSALLVIWGMLVVIISRTVLNRVARVKRISIGTYMLIVLGEIAFMAGFYTIIELFVLKDERFWGEIFYIAIQNTSLILLIPYTFSLLFFAYQDKKRNIEELKQGGIDPFISFRDETGTLRITIKADNLLYFEASENYVIIHYLQDQKIQTYLLRNSLKRMEQEHTEFGLMRCHRSYMVSLKRVHHARREGGGYKLYLDTPGECAIPVSKTYAASLMQRVSGKMLQGGKDGATRIC